jgi:4-amino-4-deoxy-L-arabinose transferase-like glycosyltransferase
MIVGAHRVYAADQPYAVLATTFPTARLVSRADRFVAQDYACIVPLLSGLLLVVCCFALGKLLFNDTVGLVAALLLSVSPAFIQASQRIWADTMLSLFVALTFLFIHLYAERGKTVYLLLSSVSLALSLLTKNYAALTLVPFALTGGLVVCARQDRRNAVIALVASLLVVALLTLPWYWLLTRALGSPWFGPRPASIDAANVWLAYLKAKPWYTYLVGIPCQAPAYLFGFGTMVGFAFTARRKIDAINLSSWFLCYLVALTYITWHDETLGPEHRYMLPAYPALAILSGLGLVNARNFLATRIGATVATLIVSLALLGSIAWSLWVAAQFLNADVINLPF